MSTIDTGPPLGTDDARALSDRLGPGTAVVHLPDLAASRLPADRTMIAWTAADGSACITVEPDGRLAPHAAALTTAQANDLAAALIAVAARVVASN
ncbi:hypothetical protein NXT08_22355 [Rhodococcus pyridinivorans]|uniref:hypothetical protein n=1 Tax=Rhodococcus pyridinivorans TaxID=103816 RepID=UPI000BA2435F|nr:hypothetical protein [Rhodococcus pyridinivorans]UVT24946.1 hypothetical protein NXT08_22355 [Rhodococcus pyridinivorans]